MAIKSSNQITFVENKVITAIKEYYLVTDVNTGVTTETSGWTETMQIPNATKRYLWNYEEIIYSIGSSTISEPVIIGDYGTSEAENRSISSIKNYYQVTADKTAPTTWEESVPELTPTNRYLWNYEVITYTDNSTTSTEPAIIGVYGDSGIDAVDFQIYSVDGFEFKSGMQSIKLQTAAFQGGEKITSGATYQWKWWNDSEYEAIADATSSSLVVNITDPYALLSLKCEMTYGDIVYEDYVSLTKKEAIYTSAIKFLDGSNIFDPSLSYIVAYVELYKDNIVEDTIRSRRFYDGNTTIESNVITTDLIGDFTAGQDLIYFRYIENGHNIAVLGQFKETTYTTVDGMSEATGTVWSVVNSTSEQYSYINDIYDDVISNVIVISKEDVAKSREINVYIQESSTSSVISTTSATVIDTNDPIISDVEPTDVKYGQLWLDTSVTPYVLRIYTQTIAFEPKKTSTVTINLVKETLQTISITLTYADNVEIQDGVVVLAGTTSNVDVTYNQINNNEIDANIISGKYFFYQNGSNASKVYYAPSTSSIECETSGGAAGLTNYSLTIEVNPIIAQEIHVGEWVYFDQQNGGTVYTSIPLDGYRKGDLWIISDEDVGAYTDSYPDLFAKFGSGSMLRALTTSTLFYESHWIDAMEDVTTMIANIKESFMWDDTGIKVMKRVTDSAGNVTNPFYVHIDSTRMGFHSVEYDGNLIKNDVEVVHIGNNSSIIQNATFQGEDGTKFENTVTFEEPINIYSQDATDENPVGFVWKVEANGSLSLAILS